MHNPSNVEMSCFFFLSEIEPVHSGPEYLKSWPKFKVQLAVYL